MSVIFQVLFFALGTVLVAGGAAAVAGRLPGNSWFGVRTPETRESPEAWRLANQAGGVGFVAGGFGLVASGFSLLTMSGALAAVFAVCGVLFALAMVAYGGLMGAKAAAVWRDRAAAEGTLPQALQPFGAAAGESCCGGAPAEDPDAENCLAGSADAATTEPAAECGVSGGCGSCSLQGTCTPVADTSDSRKHDNSR